MLVANTSILTLDQWLANFFNNLTTSAGWSYGNLILCFIAVVLCVFLCGCIGIEREKRARGAGLRTHLLVGVGSCIIMIISIYGFPQNVGNRDVARLAAQAVTGVGFLGAGTIVHYNGGIKGLTTASTIWLTMAIGLACGSLNLILAIFGTAVIMLVLIVFRKFERYIFIGSPYFRIIASADCPLINETIKIAGAKEYKINEVICQNFGNPGDKLVETTFKVTNSKKVAVDADSLKAEIEKIPGVVGVYLLNHH